MLDQECSQGGRAVSTEELPQCDLDDGTFAHTAAQRNAAQFVTDLPGQIHRNTLCVVRVADSRRQLGS
jgi:hypothetical protein